MLDPDSLATLRAEVARQVGQDRAVLHRLCESVRPLKTATRPIRDRAATTIALVAADGGNRALQFDPFLVQLVRVVDSNNRELTLEVVSPSLSTDALSDRHLARAPADPLGRMMRRLDVVHLTQLSTIIPPDDGQPRSAKWVETYRELIEWATLLTLVETYEFASDTLIVFDGLLRSTIFRGRLLDRYFACMNEAILRHLQTRRRRVWLAGVAKKSKVLQRNRLALALEGVLTETHPVCVEVPRSLEISAYERPDFARELSPETRGQAAGRMYWAKFGPGAHDPIWPVDILAIHADYADVILGHLLADARNGFPVPHHPLCLQRAHENASLGAFDGQVLQDMIFSALRDQLGAQAPALDLFRLLDPEERVR